MTGYLCKYTPVEILRSFGESFEKIEPLLYWPRVSAETSFHCADGIMHPNICAYVRGVLEDSLQKGLKKVILVNCCDSVRRLYDVMKSDPRFDSPILLDLPRKTGESSVDFYAQQIETFIATLEIAFKRKLDANFLFKILLAEQEKAAVMATDSRSRPKPEKVGATIRLALGGARMSTTLRTWIQTYPVSIQEDLTCTSPERILPNCASIKPYSPTDAKKPEFRSVLKGYAFALLNQTPCMRMNDVQQRLQRLKASEPLDGIIYQTVKFCDFYGYEYAHWMNEFSYPVLKIETDYTPGSNGQLKTRLEAFLETIRAKKGIALEPFPHPVSNVEKKEKVYTAAQMKKPHTTIVAGIDAGSTSVNVVIMDGHHNLLSYSIVKTGSKSGLGAQSALNEALSSAHLTEEDIDYVVSTGYGRAVVTFGNETVTEITCHAKGALFLDAAVRTVIDIGGQDSKAIRLEENGNVKDFVMNDKCAAGTGKFLEMMARTLEMEVDELGDSALLAKERIQISSMCTVFAESEVISLIAQNKETPDIIRGLCDSVASRTAALVSRVGKEEKIMMTGGVAKNIGVVKSLIEKLQMPIVVPPEPQIVGALGAAIIALERLSK